MSAEPRRWHHAPPGDPLPTGEWWPVCRRGLDHGWVGDDGAAQVPVVADRTGDWEGARAVLWPGAVDPRPWAGAIDDTLAMFERLREGATFLDELDGRLGDSDRFRYAGSTIDHADTREIERVFIDAVEGRDKLFADITARLSWIADDPSDLSLRIRFSYGHESLGEWLENPDGMPWSAALCEEVFPESEAIAEALPLHAWLAARLGGDAVLGERIIYNNAPGGGAVFHHDADPGQRGVLFTQLAGRTAWLALPRRVLGALVAQRLGWTEADGVAALAEPISEQVWGVLNGDAAFTAQVVQRGGLFVLEPGDVLVMATHSEMDNTWHSVFALGDEPSLAHSYGIFVADPDAVGSGDGRPS